MNELEALNLAIQREEEAFNYYTNAASRVTSANGKRMLSWLASEEKGHIRILEKLCGQLEKSGKWLCAEEYTCSDLSDPLDCSELPSRPPDDIEQDFDLPEMDILKIAMDAESEAVDYYNSLAADTMDADGRAMLKKLAGIEKGHLDLLEEEYEWLKKSKEMFTIHRFDLRAS